MQKLAEICIRRPVFASMIVLALVVVGTASYFRLGVDRFPSVDLPNVSIRTTLPGASPEEVETVVSQPIEEVVNTVQGIEELRSISGQGTSAVIATFNLKRDIDSAAQDVRDRVATVLNRLPPDIDPPVIAKFNNDDAPILTIAVSGDRSLRELTEFADKIVKVQLERSAGVGEVRLVGSLDRAINVWIDADRLAAYQIPITAVRDAIRRQNADIPGGNVTGRAQEEVLRTMGRIVAPREFNDLTVATVNGAPIRIRDIGSRRGRHQGAALAGAAQRRADGAIAGSAPVGRQHGGGHRGGETEPRAGSKPPARRHEARSDPRSIALHLRRAARDQPALDPRQLSGLHRRARLHAQLALDHHRGGGDPRFGGFHLRHDVGPRLHAQ